MAKKKINNICFILIIVIILLIIIPAVKYIMDNHYNSMYLVIEKKVVEAAKDCYNDNKCENNIITLKELIEKNYLTKMYDPVSKELINLDSYVNVETSMFTIAK